MGGHSATSATSPLRVTDGTASSLIEELDRNLSEIQQACHEEQHVDGVSSSTYCRLASTPLPMLSTPVSLLHLAWEFPNTVTFSSTIGHNAGLILQVRRSRHG